jgi:two-component system chemotaxis sensor kinase CheA
MFTDEEISIFFEELEEKIQVISDNLLLMEKGGAPSGAIQEIFRAAHTIKGSSAVMGYEKMAGLTHEIENIFDRLRQGDLAVDERLVDILFEALDTLRALKDEIMRQKSETTDVAGVIARLRECALGGGGAAGAPAAAEAPRGNGAGAAAGTAAGAAGALAETAGAQEAAAAAAAESVPAAGVASSPVLPGEIPPLNDIEEAVVREAEVRGYQAYWVEVAIDAGCQMKGARAFLVFETLQQAGEIIKSVPPAEELEAGNYGSGFALLLFTQEDAGQIKNLVFSIAEVADVKIRQVRPSLAADRSAPSPWRPAGAPASAGRKETAAEQGRENVKTVRVDVQKLDTLMNLVGELVIDRTRLDRFVEIFENRYGDELAENILEISSHLGQVTSTLQEEIMKARMLPVAFVFNRLPRMVRDLAHKMGKEIDFVIEGRETELDRNVIEVIGDPLIHLLRNAVDHGIEPPEERVRRGKPRTGKIILKAAYVEGQIVITLADDGRGMDPAAMRQKAVENGLLSPEAAARLSDKEALDLIFTPGFSTAADVNDISGRGVGMDIVRSQIEQINGSVEYASVPGAGTTFTIKLPLTLAIIRALMVGLGEQVYAFPLANVVETLALRPEEVRRVGHGEVIVVRGHVLPLLRLAHLFQQEGSPGERVFVVVLGSGSRKVGVVVDRLIGEQEIVIKSLGGYLGQVHGLSGATILGDGSVALIVDARSIVKEGGVEEALTAAG